MTELDGRTKEAKVESRLKALEEVVDFIRSHFKVDIDRYNKAKADESRRNKGN